LEKLGFKVVELINNKRTKIGKNAFINIFAADNCNPSLCYKFTGCADLSAKEKHSQQIDSLSLIDDGKNVVMNVNDCPFDLAKSTFYEIKNQYKKIDILLTGYGGAGPYPQCFENLNLKEKKVAALEKEKKFLIQATKFIDEMRPEYYLPFAGTYTLTGKLSNLQSLRGVPNIDKAYNFFESYYLSKSESQRIKPLKLNPGSTFDFNTHHYDKEYKLFDHNDYDKYINKNLCKKEMSYEKDETPNFEEIYEIAKKAHHRFIEKIKSLNIKLKSDIFIKVDDKSLKLGLDKNLSIVPTKKIDLSSSRYVIYETDIRLLKRLLMGPKFAHWNNAEIGSHLKFFRRPDIFERNVYSAMCYFHS
jgi:UDP-MurNAc hydroxylase